MAAPGLASAVLLRHRLDVQQPVCVTAAVSTTLVAALGCRRQICPSLFLQGRNFCGYENSEGPASCVGCPSVVAQANPRRPFWVKTRC
jgi:hypothetical protein